jgi:hypothetical protein
MKTPAINMYALIFQKVRARILKGLVTLTALGTPKKVECCLANFSLVECKLPS